MPMNRTPQDILDRMSEIEPQDFFGFQRSDLMDFLPYDQAKQFLKPEVTKEQWDGLPRKDPLDHAREYLPFAWDKANNCRGISASRSVEHFKAWLWLAGLDATADLDALYDRYGKPCLVAVSEYLGFDWRAEDNDSWVNDESSPGLHPEEVNQRVLVAQQMAEKWRASSGG